jgi:hypothetical protein
VFVSASDTRFSSTSNDTRILLGIAGPNHGGFSCRCEDHQVRRPCSENEAKDTLANIGAVLGLPMREFFDVDEADVSDDRQRLLMSINTLVSQMDDRQLGLLVKLGQVLQDDDC